MSYIFGPINSRRFGLSLGIDLSFDTKRCNFDCLYCELEPKKASNSHDHHAKVADILDELKKALVKFENCDVITITANGEPTLYPHLEELVDSINLIKKEKKLLILTNSSTIVDENIRKILSKIDIVKCSLDSVDPKNFKKIDRPYKDIELEDIKKALLEFGSKYASKMVMETLFVKGVNDSEEDIKALSEFYRKLDPSRVDIGTIDRPPAYDVKPVSNERLLEIVGMMDGLNVSIAYRKDMETPKFDYDYDEILRLLKRRPLSTMDVDILFSSDSKQILSNLIKDQKVKTKDRSGVIFYFS